MAHAHSPTIARAGSIALGRPLLLPVAICIAIALLISIGFVWTRQRVLNLEYEVSSLENNIRTAKQEVVKQQLEVAMLRQASRIEQLARTEFGLTMPDPRMIIVVR